MMPIHQRVIESKPQTLSAGRIDILAHEISAGSLLRGAVISEPGIEITKSFVMLRSHYHVFHAGTFSQPRPGPRGIRNGTELGRQTLVFADWNTFIFHHPLVPLQRAVETPVNEHSEPGRMPPLHSPLAICDGRSCRRTVVNRPWLLSQSSVFLSCSNRQGAGR